MYGSLFLSIPLTFRPTALLKRDSNTGVFLPISRSFFKKTITRTFIMLNKMMINENKIFTSVSIFHVRSWSQHGVCDHDLRKEIKILIIIFNMTKLLWLKSRIEASHDPIFLSDIGWARLLIFIILNTQLRDEPAMLMLWSLFLAEIMFHIKHQGTVSILIFPALPDRFCRNILPIYLLFTISWLFLSRTKLVSQANSFGIHWLSPQSS